MKYVGSCQIITPNCMASMGIIREGWSEVGRSEDNGLECGVGRARGRGSELWVGVCTGEE